MSYGAIYPVTWWGSPIDGGFGDIYYNLVDNVISELLNELQAKADNYENEANTIEILEDLEDCNLLEDASLVLTPTGYSEGLIHPTKPADSLGDELVTNGGFDTDDLTGTGMTLGGDISITDGVLKYFDIGGDNNYTRLEFASLLTIGKTYKLSFEITELNLGKLEVITGGSNLGIFDEVKNYTLTFVADDPLLNFKRNFVNGGTFDFSIDNISVKEVLSADLTYTRTGTTTRTNSEGNTETISEDVPVINYENFVYDKPDLVTNGDFETNSDWTFNSPWSYDAVNKQATGTFAGTFENLVQFGVMTIGTVYDVTVDADLSGITAGSLKFSNSSFSEDGDARTILDGVNTYTLTALDNDLRIGGGGSTGTGIIKNVIVRETGAVITDYDAAIVIEDGAVLNGGYSDLFDPQNGSLFVRCRNKANDGQRRQIIMEESVADDRVVFRFEPTSNRVQAVIRDNGSSISTITQDLTNTLEYSNYTVTWTNGEFKLYVDGVLLETKTPNITGVQGISTIRTEDFNGDIEVLNVYKRVLTQDEIDCLQTKF